MMDAFLARYGNQDIHRLRGVKELSWNEKRIFASCLEELMEREFSADGDGAGGSGSGS
jgi:hypothetical protein